MAKTVTLGGDRLGSGKKQKLHLHNYERSTHDLGYIWRSTMATGTLVPFLKQVALPGDTFDIRLNADVKTLPTVGPLFGSFKLQLDVFACPIRLYNAQLHMNKLGIGMDMSKVKFPIHSIQTRALNVNRDIPIELQQINTSSLMSYLGIKGNGINMATVPPVINPSVNWNAMPLLMYWDIYKNYYSNKQEEIGAYITPDFTSSITEIKWNATLISPPWSAEYIAAGDTLIIKVADGITINDINLFITTVGNQSPSNIFNIVNQNGNEIAMSNPKTDWYTYELSDISVLSSAGKKGIKVSTFPLENIDKMRDNILKKADSTAFAVTNTSLIPYGDSAKWDSSNLFNWAEWSMNGLGLKTYQSDIFNNWLSTDWIDGTGGINEISSVDTSSGSFTIDTLNLSKKVYDMLNRIAVSGGSYEDWLQAVYSHEPYRRSESPMYMGGLSKEVVFQEVVSQSETPDQPLASLAGRGTLTGKNKGGYVVIKVDEPSYIIGIISLTPRIDYSQGNDWDMKLSTMNDLHKPALDQIGFQDLTTDKMAFWERWGTSATPVLYSAGKQPAWIDYMTNYNRCYGNFANPDDQMFMTLNRRYEIDGATYRIKDLTTYIDPKKFNYIFADTQRDAQNFWVQLAVDVTARRKMSAKVIPNL